MVQLIFKIARLFIVRNWNEDCQSQIKNKIQEAVVLSIPFAIPLSLQITGKTFKLMVRFVKSYNFFMIPSNKMKGKGGVMSAQWYALRGGLCG